MIFRNYCLCPTPAWTAQWKGTAATDKSQLRAAPG